MANEGDPQVTRVTLDGLFPQLIQGSAVIVEQGAARYAAQVTEVMPCPVAIDDSDDAPKIPVTEIRLQPSIPNARSAGLKVHFQMVTAGVLTRVAKTRLRVDDVDGAALEAPVEAPEAGLPDELLLHDAEERGQKVGGTVEINPRDPLGAGVVMLYDDEAEFPRALRAPVNVLGNLVEATRGESVFNEVLGSGDASETFQSFALAQKPLTHLADSAAPDGRRSTLEVWVNGILCKEARSFFGAGPGDLIYVVRQNDEEESIVTFGDGVTGARLPTGVDNVVASYRHGAGAAKPPANSITQLSRPVNGLARVLNPIAAAGGRDADTAGNIRENAAASGLTLGRAVSLLDFEALAYDFGVLNAHASWAWDETCQRAVVKLWIISDGGSAAEKLRAYLIGQADPNTPLGICEAVAVETALVIDLEVDARHEPDAVELNVTRALSDPQAGLLAPRNVPIGCPLFRSLVFEQVLSVDGVISVRRMSVNGKPAPAAITVDEGSYHRFLPNLKVGNTAAGDMLFADQDPPMPQAPGMNERAACQTGATATQV